MEHKRINWCALPAKFVSENSQIPHDITFKFVDGEVSANKTILSMVSDVFLNMFFVHDTKDNKASEIVIEGEGITRKAFKIMINAMHNAKSIEESLQGSSVPEIFAVMYLVTKYEIPDLVLAVKDSLSSLHITEANVLDIAEATIKYLATFEEDAHNVLLSCAKFLKSNVTNYKSLLGDRIAVVHTLVALMDEMTPPPPPSTNCNKEERKDAPKDEKEEDIPGLTKAMMLEVDDSTKKRDDTMSGRLAAQLELVFYFEGEEDSRKAVCEGCGAEITTKTEVGNHIKTAHAKVYENITNIVNTKEGEVLPTTPASMARFFSKAAAKMGIKA